MTNLAILVKLCYELLVLKLNGKRLSEEAISFFSIWNKTFLLLLQLFFFEISMLQLFIQLFSVLSFLQLFFLSILEIFLILLRLRFEVSYFLCHLRMLQSQSGILCPLIMQTRSQFVILSLEANNLFLHRICILKLFTHWMRKLQLLMVICFILVFFIMKILILRPWLRIKSPGPIDDLKMF